MSAGGLTISTPLSRNAAWAASAFSTNHHNSMRSASGSTPMPSAAPLPKKETILASVCCSSPDRLSDEIVAHAMLPLLLQSLEQILQLQVRCMIHSLHYPKTGISFLR